MAEKDPVVHITLTVDEKKAFNAAVESSDYNKSVFAKKALMREVNTQNKKSKMRDPKDIRDGMRAVGDDERNA